MRSTLSCLATVFALLTTTGCLTSRTTQTARTAVEMALLTEAVERALYRMSAETEGLESAFIDVSEVATIDKEYINSAFRRMVLVRGLAVKDSAEDADVTIYPRVGIMGIDEGGFLIGIPSFPIPVPTVGTIETPELALFRRSNQTGRAKIGAYAVSNETGRLAFDYDRETASVYDTRFRALLIIGWRATNLVEPYTRRRQDRRHPTL